MELMEFSYHAEMTKALLQVQQAKAKIDARKLIVEGGVMIVKDALQRLDEEGIEISRKTKLSLTKDLMLVTCGESGPPQPVLTL
jgi:predicted nucleic acid-binding protein